MNTAHYQLFRGDTLLGTLTVQPNLCDFPWYGGRFEPAPDYAEVEPLFNKELRLLDAEDYETWESIWAQIDLPRLALLPLNGGERIDEVLIHIEGDVAHWRC
jgi:hypothetical protein